MKLEKPKSNKPLLEFPCSFSIKAMGPNSDEFESSVVSVVRKHALGFDADSVTSRLSKGGNYRSVTVTFEAQNQEQINAIYQELNSDQQVLMTL